MSRTTPLALLLAFLWTLSTTAQSSADYFPVVAGTLYTYNGVFNGNKSSGTLRLDRKVLSDKTEVFYFARTNELNREHHIIGSNAFGLGCYFHGKEGVYTVEAFWNFDLDTVTSESKQILLPASLKAGTKWDLQIKGSDPKTTLEVVGFENVKVTAGEFKDCVKLHRHEIWANGKEYDSYAWFAKGVGMVKWVRSTGRIDELAKVEKP